MCRQIERENVIGVYPVIDQRILLREENTASASLTGGIDRIGTLEGPGFEVVVAVASGLRLERKSRRCVNNVKKYRTIEYEAGTHRRGQPHKHLHTPLVEVAIGGVIEGCAVRRDDKTIFRRRPTGEPTIELPRRDSAGWLGVVRDHGLSPGAGRHGDRQCEAGEYLSIYS